MLPIRIVKVQKGEYKPYFNIQRRYFGFIWINIQISFCTFEDTLLHVTKNILAVGYTEETVWESS